MRQSALPSLLSELRLMSLHSAIKETCEEGSCRCEE
jgi:hypothetical protein